MEIFLVILQVVLAITSVLLILFILLHRGKGGGLSDMFGGGITSSASSSGVAEKNLNRMTTWTLVIWAISIVLMGVISKFMTPGVM
ncbi:preprotein translocase subunit SecG [Gulosibacter molinativorax]|uniref:Protein-export membrane protein SecG n=1 Tax=Gulosibacter molinativorax TaxID=256821 RepID=A0ABT7C7D1_9MICO|nr:preprotein translocase subunit SecG [Gulosibacter molinativorax]MDJ1371110.1 preprotein translocase subunit SecG [Gulosibacter molinativorax]QUY61470.1 Preprotein translocase, SecG subunit [Gulosibacter molinativorax]